MNRIVFAFRSFFAILFKGTLPADIAEAFGFVPRAAERPAAPVPQFGPADGALQMLGILQRDSRLIDFVMEDISAYADDQVGAAVRTLHEQCRETVTRYVQLAPVIDGVEGTFTKLDAAGPYAKDPSALKLLGNVPANNRPAGGLLRHKGWRAEQVELPPLVASQNPKILAPAEIEVE
ncbi:MAG: DUF2760 domain-containing protein [Bryobacteraceae bacterium]